MRVLRYRAKGVLRQRMRALRNSIPRESLAERSAKICAGLLSRPELSGARAVALFWPILKRGEVDLRPLAADLRARGVVVAFPAIDPATKVMTFRIPADPAAMEEHGLGFQEPLPSEPEVGAVDVVVVPALGVDGEGNRLGYGAGYYDRTLPRFCPPAVAIGVVYDFQVLSEVPATEGDVPLPVVVTDERVIEV
ncbi:5-formyltetrahydrofolate cyclo-ligase [Polyangium spumosum]|uniref:5-formyltetrahydrofolate cyclo-ligase n=2 Tax=Polyangium spumosum TaxID=889282 RepID=A0A6N7PPX1_9BACT|nr:5-formyltetrahydrofolate cyclo-ligase [Polyangium spumosum]